MIVPISNYRAYRNRIKNSLFNDKLVIFKHIYRRASLMYLLKMCEFNSYTLKDN